MTWSTSLCSMLKLVIHVSRLRSLLHRGIFFFHKWIVKSVCILFIFSFKDSIFILEEICMNFFLFFIEVNFDEREMRFKRMIKFHSIYSFLFCYRHFYAFLKEAYFVHHWMVPSIFKYYKTCIIAFKNICLLWFYKF